MCQLDIFPSEFRTVERCLVVFPLHCEMIPSQGMRRQLVSIAISRKVACHRKTSTKHDAGKLQNNLREKKPAKQSAWEPGTWSHATSRPPLICLSSCIFAFMCLSFYVFVYFSICVFLHLWVTQPLNHLWAASPHICGSKTESPPLPAFLQFSARNFTTTTQLRETDTICLSPRRSCESGQNHQLDYLVLCRRRHFTACTKPCAGGSSSSSSAEDLTLESTIQSATHRET